MRRWTFFLITKGWRISYIDFRPSSLLGYSLLNMDSNSGVEEYIWLGMGQGHLIHRKDFICQIKMVEIVKSKKFTGSF